MHLAHDAAPAISLAGPSDLDEIVPLFDGYRQFYGQSTNPAGCRDFLADRLTAKDSVILIARIAGRAVGFTQLYPTYSSVAMRPVWILNDLFVDPHQRSRGIGSALLRHAADRARQDGVARMVLSTAADNTTARRVYERDGWELEKVFVQYKRPL